MLHIFKYVLDKKDYGLIFNPIFKKNEPWDLIYYSDNGYAGGKYTRQDMSWLYVA